MRRIVQLEMINKIIIIAITCLNVKNVWKYSSAIFFLCKLYTQNPEAFDIIYIFFLFSTVRSYIIYLNYKLSRIIITSMYLTKSAPSTIIYNKS